ncbi:hypothetical protein GcM1_104001 [Golovinomyces cichoracearum]|uniref:Uncharacterized protein n=1 Tax=Golovinomyces cichoracearum TaxID=62708 RepID=A0A420JC19_9PEZI|nr:hypothetical protein GcM1_104001 [Golovinomyces cichoracearum]
MEDTRAKQATTDNLTKAKSDAALHHVTQFQSQFKELDDRLNTIKRILRKVVDRIDSDPTTTLAPSEPTQSQQAKDKSRETPFNNNENSQSKS